MPIGANELHIGDHNWFAFVDQNPMIDGQERKRGLIPRDYQSFPVGSYAGSRKVDFPLIARSEWSELIKHKVATKSQLSDIRNRGNNGQPIPSRDQNGKGYCWMHSGCSALLVTRAREMQPYVSLSAYMGACIIKQYRDEGGWGAQGLDWIMEHGLPDEKFWPQQSMARTNDTPEMRANAKQHRFTEGWIDLDAAQYDRNLTFDQMATCLLLNVPVLTDFNWWGHAVCALDLVETSPGQFGIRIWNSWGDSWSDNGLGVLSGSKAIPNGATAPSVATAA